MVVIEKEVRDMVDASLEAAGFVVFKPQAGESPVGTANRIALYVGPEEEEIHRLKAEIQKREKMKVGIEMSLKEALGEISDDEIVQLIFKAPNFRVEDLLSLDQDRFTFPLSSLLCLKIATLLEETRCARIVELGDAQLASYTQRYQDESQELRIQIGKAVKDKKDESLISLMKARLARKEKEIEMLPLRWAVFLGEVVNAYPQRFTDAQDLRRSALTKAVNSEDHRRLWQDFGLRPCQPLNGIIL